MNPFGFLAFVFRGMRCLLRPAQLGRETSILILDSSSAINRPMVAIDGQASFCRSQNSLSSGWIFSFPRLGCSARMILIMRMISMGHRRIRRFRGALSFTFKEVRRPLPSFRRFFHSKRVARLVAKAACVALSPYRFQNRRILARCFASLVTIWTHRMAYWATCRKPIISSPIRLICIPLWWQRSPGCI